MERTGANSTSLEYSTHTNRTNHKFEAQYILKAYAEDKYSHISLVFKWSSQLNDFGVYDNDRPNTTVAERGGSGFLYVSFSNISSN